MFERYTEKARRAIFFARYEASSAGSSFIESEHLLLGALREDKALTQQLMGSQSPVEAIRKQIEGHAPFREKMSTSIDLPLSNECKRVLAYGAEEAEMLGHRHIGSEHLVIGLMREKTCFAAKILKARGVRVEALREYARTATLSFSRETSLSGQSARMNEEAMRALGFAAEEARLAGANQIGAGDLLLGLLRSDGAPVAELLREMGLEADVIRGRLRTMGKTE